MSFMVDSWEALSTSTLNYSWSEIGRTNLIVHRDITSYNRTLKQVTKYLLSTLKHVISTLKHLLSTLKLT